MRPVVFSKFTVCKAKENNIVLFYEDTKLFFFSDSFPVLSNEVGNHIVDFKFETENSNPASIEMSFKSFQFREGNGQQRITCKIMTCEGKCDQGKVTLP